jgi:hypothetical protein
MEPEGSSPHLQEPAGGLLWMCRNRIDEELLASRPTQKQEDHPLSAVCDWLFNIFAVNLRRPFLHSQPEDAPCRGDRDSLILLVCTYSLLLMLILLR